MQTASAGIWQDRRDNENVSRDISDERHRSRRRPQPAGCGAPAAVEVWLRANVPQLVPPLRWTRLEGGHSNLTYRLDDSLGNKAVIRRPPLGELLPKAHDMRRRKWAVMSALRRHRGAGAARARLLRRPGGGGPGARSST